MSWFPTHLKEKFGMIKSSDKIHKLLSDYLHTDLSLEKFKTEYSYIINAKANPVFGKNTKNVNNIPSRIKYLIKDALVHVVMLTSLPFMSDNLCEHPTLKKINALRKLEPNETGGEFGIIFDKYLQMQKEESPNEEITKHLKLIEDCLVPQFEPELWDKSGLNTNSFANAKGGRRTRYRKRKFKARKTRRS